MPGDVTEPESPPDVGACPHVTLPELGPNVVPWPWGLTPTLQSWAAEQLVYPLGTIVRDVVDGRPAIARIECHDRYGADPGRAPSWHKGTSVYAPGEVVGGRLVAMAEPPAGWPGA